MNQKGFAPILFFLIILIISTGIIGGALAIKKYYPSIISQNNPPKNQSTSISSAPQPTISFQASSTPSPILDEDTNWLKLRNNSCSLSLQYPSTWTIKINKEGTDKSVGIVWDGCVIQVKNTETEYIIITSIAPTKTWEEIQESLRSGVEDLQAKGYKKKMSEVKINGQTYTSKLDETMPQLTQLGAYFRNADQIFSLIGFYAPNTESQNNLYKILESIKFNSVESNFPPQPTMVVPTPTSNIVTNMACGGPLAVKPNAGCPTGYHCGEIKTIGGETSGRCIKN